VPHPSLACFRPLTSFVLSLIRRLIIVGTDDFAYNTMPVALPPPHDDVGTTPVRSHYGRVQPTARRAIPPTPPTCTYLGPIPNSEKTYGAFAHKGHRHTIHHTLARNLTLSPQPDTAGRLLPLRRASVARASVVQ